jgi:hypothetical protein
MDVETQNGFVNVVGFVASKLGSCSRLPVVHDGVAAGTAADPDANSGAVLGEGAFSQSLAAGAEAITGIRAALIIRANTKDLGNPRCFSAGTGIVQNSLEKSSTK